MINWDKAYKERRAKILWIPRHQVLDSIIGPSSIPPRVLRVALPRTWRVYDVFFDFHMGAFGFLIISDEFPQIADGICIPSLDPETVDYVQFSEKKKVTREEMLIYFKHGEDEL